MVTFNQYQLEYIYLIGGWVCSTFSKSKKKQHPQGYIHKSVWSSRCSYVQEDVKTIPFLLYVVNRHTRVQAIQMSFLSNIKCSNHRNNRACKSMRNCHSGGCETKQAVSVWACMCVSITVNSIHYTEWIITARHTQIHHCPHTTYKKHLKTHARTQALTCIGNEVTLWCKNAGGALAMFVQCDENLVPWQTFHKCSYMLLRARMKKSKVWWGARVEVLNRSNQESWWGSVTNQLPV